MSMRLFSGDAEKRAIRAFCGSPSKTIRQIIQSGLKEDHFETEVGREAFRRIKLVFRKRGEIISWRELCEDPALSSTTKSALKSFKGLPPKTTANARTLLGNLDNYCKLRTLNHLSRSISEALQAQNAKDGDLDTLFNEVTEIASQIHGRSGAVRTITIGTDSETGSAAVKRLLKGEVETFLPTGFRAFDNENHGLLWGSMALIASPSGNGKSAMAHTLARNFATIGAPTLVAALEMNCDNMLQRDLSMLTGIGLTKLLNPKKTLTTKDKEGVELAYKKFNRQLKRSGGKLTYYSPDEDAEITSILSYAKLGGYKVVVIDYVGLLAGTDGDDQVRALGRITRQCKLWAGANDAIVVLVAQLKDDGGVKYASKMKEDAVNMWQFMRTPQDREMNIVRVHPTKSRQQSDRPFTLFFDASTMTIRDLTPEEAKALAKADSVDAARAPPRKGGKGGRKPFFTNLV